MSLYSANHRPAKLMGPAANRPAGAKLQELPFGTQYTAQDTGVLSEVRGIPGSTRAWLEFSSSSTSTDKTAAVASSAGVALPAYTVSADKTTLTANAFGTFPAQDEVTLTLNQRFMLQDGASQIDNGLYLLTNAGSAGTSWVLTRTSDMPVGSGAAGTFVLVEQGALNGSQTFAIAQAPGADVVGTNPLTWVQTSRSAPYASPTIWVGGTNASNRNDGLTTGNPLATVGEAFGRLWVRGYTGTATINVQGTTAEGANPNWGVPVPQGNAGVVRLQGIYTDAGTGTVTASGGTLGSLNSPPTLGTTTTALAPVANAFRGMFQSFDTGGNAGQRRVIDSNTAGGTFTNCGLFAGAPINGDTFHIQDLLGKIGYTGVLTILAPGGLIVDGIEFDIATGIRLFEGWVYSTACRFLSTGAAAFFSIANNAIWYDNGIGSTAKPNVTANYCGSRWDGSNGGLTIGGQDASSGWAGELYFDAASMQAVDIILQDRTAINSPSRITITRLSSINGCGVLYANSGCGDEFLWNQSVATLCRKTASSTSAAFEFVNCGDVTFFQMALTNTLGGSTLFRADGCKLVTNTISGLNPAGGTPLTLLNYAQWIRGASSTVTGSIPGSDVVIDTDTPIAWVDANVLNRITATAGGSVLSFGGGFTMGGAATNAFVMDDVPSATASSATGFGRRVPANCRIRNMLVQVLQNNMDTATTVTFDLAGGGTLVTVSVGAGATGSFQILGPAAVAVAAAQAQFDIHFANPNATAGRTFQAVGTVELVPA